MQVFSSKRMLRLKVNAAWGSGKRNDIPDVADAGDHH